MDRYLFFKKNTSRYRPCPGRGPRTCSFSNSWALDDAHGLRRRARCAAAEHTGHGLGSAAAQRQLIRGGRAGSGHEPPARARGQRQHERHPPLAGGPPPQPWPQQWTPRQRQRQRLSQRRWEPAAATATAARHWLGPTATCRRRRRRRSCSAAATTAGRAGRRERAARGGNDTASLPCVIHCFLG